MKVPPTGTCSTLKGLSLFVLLWYSTEASEKSMMILLPRRILSRKHKEARSFRVQIKTILTHSTLACARQRVLEKCDVVRIVRALSGLTVHHAGTLRVQHSMFVFDTPRGSHLGKKAKAHKPCPASISMASSQQVPTTVFSSFHCLKALFFSKREREESSRCSSHSFDSNNSGF